MTTHIPDELQILRAANPVAPDDVHPAPEGLYDRLLAAHSPRRRSKRRLLVVAAAASAIAIGLALLPARLADKGRVDVVELALAAVSNGPVLHAVIESSDFSATLIDLQSEEKTSERLRSEIWFDEKRELLHGRVSIGETVAFDGVGAATMVDPALAGFATRYREALESGQAKIVGETTVDGRRAILLRITLNPGGLAEEVAVDAEDYRPLEFRLIPGPNDPVDSDRSFRVISIETIERDSADFSSREPFLHSALTENEGEITVEKASTALGRPSLWPGRAVQGVELRKIELLRVETRWAKGRPKLKPTQPAFKTEKPALVFEYGPEKGGRSLTMTVGTSAEELPLVGPLPHQRVPAGKLRLIEFRGRVWFGALERDGLHVKFESPDRELILAAANALEPLG